MVYMEQELLQSPKGTTKADAQFCILIDPLGVAVQTVVYYNEQQDNTCFFLDGACWYKDMMGTSNTLLTTRVMDYGCLDQHIRDNFL